MGEYTSRKQLSREGEAEAEIEEVVIVTEQ